MRLPLLDAFKPKPIKRQIALYVEWKAIRYPLAAKQDGEFLGEFFKHHNITCASFLTVEQIHKYINSVHGEYYKQSGTRTLRQFCRYWYKIGLLSEEFATRIKRDTVADMIGVHPLTHVDQVQRVQGLRAKGLSYRKIKERMEAEDKRKYDIHAIYRWSKYELRPLSTPPSESL